jgi:hypothetical protein
LTNFLIFVFSRCQLLSCTSEKCGKKKNRKNRLRAFPSKWNELSKENREEIRRLLRKFIFLIHQNPSFFLFSSEIPSDVQRCCTRCYDKLIVQVRQRQTNPTIEEEEDDDESNMNQNSKHDDG